MNHRKSRVWPVVLNQMNAALTTLPDEWLNDEHLHQLTTQGFCVIDHACPQDLFLSLCEESEQQSPHFQQAKIADGLNQHIRSDRTRWLNLEDHAGGPYLQLLDSLGILLNQFFYAGIRRVEAHYALYQPGDFYQAHRDNPTGSNLRAMSSVFYLNREWHDAWGGQLRLQDHHEQWHDLAPMPNRLVIFQSDLLHEVCPATQTRRSIAGWLRRDEPLL